MMALELNKYIADRLEEGLVKLSIPDYMHDGIRNYLLRGIHPGVFLKAVISNQLVESFYRADLQNISRIKNYANLLYNYFPGAAWGSPEKFLDWMKKFTEKKSDGE